MPKITITNIDGEIAEITDARVLKMEMGYFEKAMDALEPLLDGEDDAAGDEALKDYDRLSAAYNAIVDRLPDWSAQLVEERRAARHAAAKEIRDSRQLGRRARTDD